MRKDPASTLLSLKKNIVVYWSLSRDFALHNKRNVKMARIAAYLSAEIILLVTE